MQDNREVLKNWDLPTISSIVEVKSDRIYQINYIDGAIHALKYIGTDEEQKRLRLDFEHNILAHLNRAGVPVANPIPTQTGATYIALDNNLYTLSQHLEHDSPWPPTTAERNFNIGQAIAKLHQSLADFKCENLGFKLWANRPGYEMQERLPWCREKLTGEDLNIIEKMVASTPSNLLQTIDQMETQIIHRDLHGGNILLKGSQVTGFIDCDHFSIGPRVYDLAYLAGQIIRFTFVTPPKPRIENWCDLMTGVLSGYAANSTITPEERHVLPHLFREVVLMFISMYCKNSRGSLPLETELSALHWLNENQTRLNTIVNENFVSPIDNL